MTEAMVVDIWNEPDLSVFWARSQDQYLQMWGRTYYKFRLVLSHWEEYFKVADGIVISSATPSSSPALPPPVNLSRAIPGGTIGVPSSPPTTVSQTNTPGTWRAAVAT